MPVMLALLRSTPGSGSIDNQVTLAYNAFHQLRAEPQRRGGGSHTTRRLTTTYPSGKISDMSYGAANSADDRPSRLSGVALNGEGQPLGEFAWMGAGRLVSLTLPQPGIALSYKHATGELIGDAGDPYSGYDCPSLRSRPARWLRLTDAAITAKRWKQYLRQADGATTPATTRSPRSIPTPMASPTMPLAT